MVKLRCVACGALAAVPIVWGLPMGPDLYRDDIAIGGCCITPDDPSWQCRACDASFGMPSQLEREGKPDPGLARAFAEYFAAWDLTIPEVAVALRLGGRIRHGWGIDWRFGRDPDGAEFLEFYASHGMTNDRHVRIDPGGRLTDLPALEDGVVVDDTGDARAEFLRRSAAIEADLRASGLWGEE